MQATVSLTEAELPFIQSPSQGSARRTEQSWDWFLGLRNAQIRFSADDRLVLLYGHPLVFRLGLYAAGERALAGEPVVYLDGGHTFDQFLIGRMAKAHRRQPRALLTMIHLARAFTCYQMERLICDCLMSALERYQARTAFLSGLFDTLYDPAVPEPEAMRLFGRIMQASQKLAQHGYVLLFLCPQPPMLTRASRRCLDQLRGQADRVISMQEDRGVLKLQDEGDAGPHHWDVPRTALDLS
jgi:hypothetical protein